MSADKLAPAFGSPVTGWWRRFAWVPVWTVDRGYVWFRPVWCRRIAKHHYLDGGPDFWFQYAIRTQQLMDEGVTA
jgi:hypothetical protein